MSHNSEIKAILKPFEMEDLIMSGSSSEETMEMLKKKVKELNSDISVLKRLIYMLNVELELRDSGHHEGENKQHLLNSDTTDDILLKTDIKMIEPLLQAFEQTKEEKDELLADYKQSFEEAANRCKNAILENDALRQQLHESKTKAESAVVEWEKLHEKYLLIEEHNQLLIRQAKLFQNKMKNFEEVYQRSLKQLEEEKREQTEKYENMKTELLLLKGKHSAYSDQKNQSQFQSNVQFDVNLTSFMFELKNISNELKVQNTNELRSLRSQIKSLESEKYDLDIKLASVTSERDHLQGYVSAIEREARKVTNDCENVKEELRSVKKNEGDAKKQIVKCMTFIRELVSVHNQTLQGKANKNQNEE